MDLVSLLETHRHDIAAAWASRLRALPGNHYRDWSADEVIAWANGALDAIVESQRTGSSAALERHATAVSLRRAEQRFEIDQVIEGLLLVNEVAAPYILGGQAARDGCGDVIGPAETLSASLRLMVAQFAAIFARLLREQREHLVVLEERTRLARDLHDSVSQSLYGVGMYAEAAARLLESGNIEEAASHLREVRDSAADALREMRFLLFDLRPSILREEGLVPALKARLAAVENRAGVEADLVADAGDRLVPDVEEAFYGIGREALNNALRHGRARRIQVCLVRRGDRVTLSVRDDGTGFDVGAAKDKGGLGLGGMRERAARVNGNLTISSQPGRGTEVAVTVTACRPDRGSEETR